MNRGDIRWLETPDAGRRPACVLTRAEAIPALRTVVVALATRTVRGIPSELQLTVDDGMPDECAISFDNLETVPKALLGDRLIRLSGVQMHEACRALAAATGCA